MKFIVTRILPVILVTAVAASGNAMAASSKTDIVSTGLKLGKLMLANGETKTVKANVAKFHTNGRCMFDASYVVKNSGPSEATGNMINILKRDGKLVRRNNVTNLKPKAKKEFNFLLALTPGDNFLELTLDNSNQIKESNEKNNKISANLKIVGRCSGKSLPARKKAVNKNK